MVFFDACLDIDFIFILGLVWDIIMIIIIKNVIFLKTYA